MVAELCAQSTPDGPETTLGALAEIPPGGHFFAAEHTMSRYQSEFYEPLVADWANFRQLDGKGRTDGKPARDRHLEGHRRTADEACS